MGTVDKSRLKVILLAALDGFLGEKQPCETCLGHGSLTRFDDSAVICPECDGDGFIFVGTEAFNSAFSGAIGDVDAAIKEAHSRPDVPYPHYICPICNDWYHMPFKFCKCLR